MIMNVSMVVRLFVVVFIIVIFVWLSSFCALPHLNINKIAPNGLQLQRLSFPHKLLLKKVVLKTSDAIYYFRVKNS